MMAEIQSVALLCCPPEMAGDAFPHLRKMIEEGYAAGDQVLPANFEDELQAGTILLWVAMNMYHAPIAAMATRFVDRISGRTLRILSVGGESMAIWKHLMGELEKHAKAEGCVKIEAQARKGWLRHLDGFSADQVIIQKRL